MGGPRPPRPDEITALLNQWADGDREALDALMPQIASELRLLARKHMRREPKDHTLQTTALVNEAYLRLLGQHPVRWQNRAQFFGIAARLMRRILIDHARRKQAAKRGADVVRVPLDDVGTTDARPESLLALHEALNRLAETSPRQAGVVELRHFGGLSHREIGEVMNLSVATVKREWTLARTWLYRQLSGEKPG